MVWFLAILVEKSCFKLSNEIQIDRNINYKKELNFETFCLQKFKSQGWEVKHTAV